MWRWFPLSLAVSLVAPPALAGSFRVGAAIEWQRTNLGRHVAGFVLLELPLDRLGAPRVPKSVKPVPAALRLAEGPPPGPGAESAAAPRADSTAATARKAEADSAPLLDVGIARRMVQAALRVQGFALSLDRLDGLAARSRASAALPELTLRAARSTDQSLRLSPSGTTVNDYTQTGGAGLLLEARAVWRLDRALFADEELRVERLRAQRAHMAERLVAQVLKDLFKVQRARRRLAEAELGPDERLEQEVELFEAVSALDVLTDGEFGREERKRAVPPGNFEEKR